MPTYLYVARDQHGLPHTGQLDGLNEDDVVAVLQRRSLLVTSISKKTLARHRPLTERRIERRLRAGVTVDDQVLLCQQLATLVEAGVPLLKSLEVVSAQIESRTLLLALEHIRHDVRGGSTLAAALARHPTIFSKLWLNLVETGEAGGHLAQSLTQLATHFESMRHIRNEAKTALTYPALLLAVAVGVCLVFVYWLIPKFTGMFAAQHMALPLLTRIVMGISEAARRYALALFFVPVAAAYLLQRYLATESGQWTRDRLVLHLPVFQQLFACVQLAEFSRSLSTLLESGVPLLTTLEILENSSTNKVYGRAIGRLREEVKEGKTMAEPMAETGLFPPIVIQMVQVGEEIGELAKMAGRIAKYYEERTGMFIARMTRLFEPIAILVMAVVVLFVVLSIFLPIFQMAGGGGGSR